MLDKLVFSYADHYELCDKIVTDSPIDEVWNRIVSLGDINYLSKRWTNQSLENYIYVSTSIKQSYEYFKASKSTSMRTRPLLLYYCILNLTKATLFMLNDNKPSDYHGLCNANTDKSIEMSSDVLSFSAEINKGVFLELAKYFKWNVHVKERITFEDFCVNAIELARTYVDYFQKPTVFVFPKVLLYNDGRLEISFDKKHLNYLNKTPDEIQSGFKAIDGFKMIDDNNKLKFEYLIGNHDEYYELRKKVELLVSNIMSFSVFNDEIYYFNIAPINKRIPNASAYFGIMYILSSIVRYKPEHIYNLVDNKDTSILSFLRRICDIVERVYPNLMVNALYGKNMKYIFGNN